MRAGTWLMSYWNQRRSLHYNGVEVNTDIWPQFFYQMVLLDQTAVLVQLTVVPKPPQLPIFLVFPTNWSWHRASLCSSSLTKRATMITSAWLPCSDNPPHEWFTMQTGGQRCGSTAEFSQFNQPCRNPSVLLWPAGPGAEASWGEWKETMANEPACGTICSSRRITTLQFKLHHMIDRLVVQIPDPGDRMWIWALSSPGGKRRLPHNTGFTSLTSSFFCLFHCYLEIVARENDVTSCLGSLPLCHRSDIIFLKPTVQK